MYVSTTQDIIDLTTTGIIHTCRVEVTPTGIWHILMHTGNYSYKIEETVVIINKLHLTKEDFQRLDSNRWVNCKVHMYTFKVPT